MVEYLYHVNKMVYGPEGQHKEVLVSFHYKNLILTSTKIAPRISNGPPLRYSYLLCRVFDKLKVASKT